MMQPSGTRRYARNAGNVFFALFGAVALVGLLGAAVMTFMKGPLSTAVKLTKMNTAETQMAIGAQVAVMATASQPSSGDCDSDGYVEPIEWRAATTEPHPTGGGLVPLTLGISKKDPWGTEYGYCVWNHGATTSGSGCAANMLTGTTSNIYPVVALISAGPDKAFTTTCRTFAEADVNTDGDLQDVGDLEMVSKAASTDDDIIFTFTYEEATGAAGGLWSLKSGDPTTATIGKDVEVAGTGSFSGGVLLPDSSLITCDSTTSGVMARNASGTGINICDGSAWQAISGGGNGIKLDDETVNTDPMCTAGNIGLMRYNTSGGSASQTTTSGGTSGVAAYVQTTAVASGTGGTATTAAFSGVPTTGNTIIVSVATYSASALDCSVGSEVTVTDNKGNTYTNAVAATSNHGGAGYVPSNGIFYAPVTSTGASFTVTATSTGCQTVRVSAAEFSGLMTAGSLDVVRAYNGTYVAGTTFTITASSTTSQADELAITLGSDASGTALTTPAGYTSLSSNTFLNGAYQILSATTTPSAVWTGGTGATFETGVLATFKAAPASGGTTTTTSSSSYVQVCNGSSWVTVGSTFLDDLDDVITNYTGTASTGKLSTHSMFLGSGVGTTATGGSANIGIGSGAMAALTTGSNNIALGKSALAANTSGPDNIAIGSDTLKANTTGADNVALGYQNLMSNTTGSNNFASGKQNLAANTTGSSNIAIGWQTMLLSTTGNYNTALGFMTLWNNTTGASNFASGVQTMYVNRTGSYNVAIGDAALKGNYAGNKSVAVGTNALFNGNNTTTSTDLLNTAVGYQTMYGNGGTGANNTAVGAQAMYAQGLGTGNAALGYQALYSNVAGSASTAIGYQAMRYAYNGTTAFDSYNTAIGYQALMGSTTASSNTGTANSALGALALLGNTTGWSNTAVGGSALYTNTIGATNIAVGGGALYTNVAGSASTAIGYKAMQYANSSSTAFTTYNTAVGYEALRGSTTAASNTGTGNTAMGYGAMTATTSGAGNTAIGKSSLSAANNGSASSNTVVGYEAIRDATIPYNNTAIGYQALAYGTGTIYDNVAVGRFASGYVTGNANVSVGGGALMYGYATANSVAIGAGAVNGLTGNYNTGVGSGVMSNATGTGNSNTGVGGQALLSLTTGNSNSALGLSSMYATTTGNYNTAIGGTALYNNVAGIGSTAIGYQAMRYANNNTTAFTTYNTAVGYQALQGSVTASANTGTGNTAVGYQALLGNTTGSSNVVVGGSLGANTTGSYNSVLGSEILRNATTATGNTAMGYQAGFAFTPVTTGGYNTFIGYQAGSNSATVTNSTALGNAAQTTANNQIVLGNTSIAEIRAQVTSITAISDRRKKKDIADVGLGLSFIDSLRPVQYRYNNGDDTLRYGFIAQDTADILPDKLKPLVDTRGIALVNHDDDKDQTYHMAYGELTAPIVKAIQEQQTMINRLTALVIALGIGLVGVIGVMVVSARRKT